MRIAIYHNLPSGGGKRALYEMVKRLASSHELRVITTSCAEHDFCDVRPYVQEYQIYPFKPLPLFRSPFGRVNAAIRTIDLYRLDALNQQIAETLDQSNFDFVFVHNCLISQAPGLMHYLRTKSVYYCGEPPRNITEPPISRLYLKRKSIQRALDYIDPFPEYYQRALFRFDRAAALGATKVLVNSAYSRESFYRLYGRFSTTCYLGVDSDKFHPVETNRSPYVCSVGTLSPNKGFDFLVESLALIPKNQRPTLVLICNVIDPSEKAYLEMLAKVHDVQMDIKSKITDDELVRLYNQAMLTVYSPIMEPFGLVPLESMACGTPVVGVNEAGVRETILNQVTGILVERDPTLFANAVICLLLNPNLIQEYGKAGRDNVLRNWTWDKTIRELEFNFN